MCSSDLTLRRASPALTTSRASPAAALAVTPTSVTVATPCTTGTVARVIRTPSTSTRTPPSASTRTAPVAAPRTRQAKISTLMRFADLAMFPSALPGTLGWAEAGQALVAKVLVPKLPSFIRMTASELHTTIRSAAAESELMARSLGLGGDSDVQA